MEQGPPTRQGSIVHAGTVLIVQPRELRVLMLLRQPTLRVLGGFWVFPGGTVDAADTSRRANEDEPDDAPRRVLNAASAACRELQEEAGLLLNPADLMHWAHWITPSVVPRRFDTHFFIAAAPANQKPRLSVAEASDLRWVAPQEWEAAATPDFPLTPPTLLVLRELAEALERHGSLDAVLAQPRDGEIRAVLPKLIERTVVLPWDPEYDHLPGEGLAWDAAAIATRAGWPVRLPLAPGAVPVAGAPPRGALQRGNSS